MGCIRCGVEGHMEYGSDGQAYCSSCVFYGMNKQCNRCRMYLPSTEMQMYAGQLYCQYCIADLRDAQASAERRIEQGNRSYAGEYAKQEHCDRCGLALSTVFILNGRKLCETCVEQEKKKWGSTGSEMPPVSMLRVRTGSSLFSRIMGALLERIASFLGIKLKQRQKESEIVVAKRTEVAGPKQYHSKKDELQTFKHVDEKPALHGKENPKAGKKKPFATKEKPKGNDKDEDEGYS